MVKKLIFCLISLFSFAQVSSAASICTYKEQNELKQKASNIKASYEIDKKEVNGEDGISIHYSININITNITEEFYVLLKNRENNIEIRFESKDLKDGIATYNWKNLVDVASFTIEVYSSSKTNCPNEKYRTSYITVPKYNEYSEREICNELTDLEVCKQFVNIKNITEDSFLKQVYNKVNGIDGNSSTNKTDEDGKNETKTNLLSIIDDYKWYIVGVLGVVLVVLVAIAKFGPQSKTNIKKPRDL